jgi:hypothetical protein
MMKRCPTCQTIYTDESLSYCLQDGSKLAVVSGSASTADETWQMSGAQARTGGAEPPPTEILRPEDMPTTRVEGAIPTKEQQRARPTAVNGETHQSASHTTISAAPRSNGAVIALSVIVGLLLVTVGGLITWIMLRDKGQTPIVTTNTNRVETQQGNNTTPQPRANTNANSNANATPQPSPVDVAAARAGVQVALNSWAETVRQGNLEEHMKYYADVLDVYYNATSVSRSRVRTDREAAFSKYSSMDMQVANINIEIDQTGTRATATFDKTFDFRTDDKSFNGSGLNRFWFTKVGGRWLITGEKELKNYYVNK